MYSIGDVTTPGEAYEVYVGAGNGTVVGFTGQIQLSAEVLHAQVKAQQTGAQILGLKENGRHYRLTIAYKQTDDQEWGDRFPWFSAGDPPLHPQSYPYDVPTDRFRLHPVSAGDADNSRDIVFEFMALEGGPNQTTDGEGDAVLEYSYLALPDPAQLPTIVIGQIGYTPV